MPPAQRAAPNKPASGPGTLVQRNNGAGQVEQMVLADTHALAEAARVKSAIEAGFAMAISRPRDWDQVEQNLLADCENWEFADESLYELKFKKWDPKKRMEVDEAVTGFSVRFAEAAMVHMTNVDVDPATTSEDGYFRRKRVTVTDMENMVRFSESITIEKTVERKFLKKGQVAINERTNADGDTVYTVFATDADIRMKENGMVSRAFRNCLLRLMKPSVKATCLKKINETLTAEVKKDPGAKRKEIMEAFRQIGVPVGELKLYLGVKDLSLLQPDQIVHLQRIFKTIRNGERKWEDIFEEQTGQVAEEVSAPEDAAQPAAPPAAAATPPPPAATRTGGISDAEFEFVDPKTSEVSNTPPAQTASAPDIGPEPDESAEPAKHFMWRLARAQDSEVAALIEESRRRKSEWGDMADEVGSAISARRKAMRNGGSGGGKS